MTYQEITDLLFETGIRINKPLVDLAYKLNSEYQNTGPKEEKEVPVPPGIVSMIDTLGVVLPFNSHWRYEEWYYRFSMDSCKINDILFNCEHWTVGEVVYYQGEHLKIVELEWIGKPHNKWRVHFESEDGFQVDLQCIRKIPPRTPVVTLQGKEMFVGDKYWYVNTDFEIKDDLIEDDDTQAEMDRDHCFHSLVLAEQFVFNSKPVIPFGELQESFANSDAQTWLSVFRKLLEKYRPSQTV